MKKINNPREKKNVGHQSTRGYELKNAQQNQDTQRTVLSDRKKTNIDITLNFFNNKPSPGKSKVKIATTAYFQALPANTTVNDCSLPTVNDCSLPTVDDCSLPTVDDCSLPTVDDCSLPTVDNEALMNKDMTENYSDGVEHSNTTSCIIS